VQSAQEDSEEGNNDEYEVGFNKVLLLTRLLAHMGRSQQSKAIIIKLSSNKIAIRDFVQNLHLLRRQTEQATENISSSNCL
jgi:hypothetical protein